MVLDCVSFPLANFTGLPILRKSIANLLNNHVFQSRRPWYVFCSNKKKQKCPPSSNSYAHTYIGILHSQPEEIQVAHGCGPLLEVVASCVADAGDAIIVPTPCYHAFILGLKKKKRQKLKINKLTCFFCLLQIIVLCPTDLTKRFFCEVVPFPMERDDSLTLQMDLTKLTKIYDDCIARGQKVRGFLLTNPHNPTGETLLFKPC